MFFDGTQFYLCGDNGTILTSTNATNWTVASTPTTAFLTSMALFSGQMVAVGDKGTILTSPDPDQLDPEPGDHQLALAGGLP